MGLSTEKINVLLKKHESKIKKEVRKRVSPNNYKLFQIDDICQEVMILIYNLFKDRYDSSISSPDTFLLSHLKYCIYKVITYISRTLYYTGKYNDNEIKKRPGSKLVDNNSIRVDPVDIENNNGYTYYISTSFDILNDYYGIVVSGTHKFPGYGTPKEIFIDLSRVYSSGDEESKILGELYVESIKKEIKKRLNDKQLQVFELLVTPGENTLFTSETREKSKGLGAKEIAKELGYNNTQSIARHIKYIRKIVKSVIENMV